MDSRTFGSLAAGEQEGVEACLVLVRRWAARQGLSPEDAEDVAAETTVRAWEGASTYAGAAKADTWVIGIARHVWSQTQRHRERKAPAGTSIDDVDCTVADAADAEQIALEALYFEEAVGCLTADELKAFTRHRLGGVSSKAVADEMGKTGNAVRLAAKRGAEKLGQFYQDNCT